MQLADTIATMEKGMYLKVRAITEWSKDQKVDMTFVGIYEEIRNEITQTSF
jgi:hypothetical protein